MKSNTKQWIFSLIMVSLIIIISYFNFYYFVRSTTVSKAKSVDYISASIKEKNNSKDVTFLNEFLHKESFYFVKTEEYLEVYNDEIQLIKRTLYPGISNELQQKFRDDVIKFGYYDNKFIYVVQSNDSERWYSIDNLEEIFAINF